MVCEGVVVRQEDVQINKVRVQSGQTAYLPLDLLLMKLFLTLCVLVVQVLKPKLVGLATTSAWAQVVRPTRQASLRMVCEGVVVRQEDAQINKVRVQPAQSAYLRSDLLMKLFLTLCVLVVQVLNLTAVGCGTALAWTPVARLVRPASLQGVREGVAHEGAVQERVVQEGVARQEDVEDARLEKVRVQLAQKAYLRLGLLQVTQFLTLCVLVVQALNRTAVGWATASAWAPVVA
ncbi:hypothetical protein PR002_g32063 [Phytophthora rubi]|uniref:Uncharacterized protein n=1 Tax=Phytophthora rubi TaxID=129364 RepID=A0A6A3G7M3_9STRA|nr:hypothetical protein PR002_g32063 [Phytophthora rubi]